MHPPEGPFRGYSGRFYVKNGIKLALGTSGPLLVTSKEMNSKRPFILLLIIAAAVSAGIYLMNSQGAVLQVMPDGLKKAPEFSLPRSNGETFGTANLKDHVAIVHFWASWCGPCIPEIPEVLAAAKKLPKDQNGRPVYWIFISQDQTWEKARTILKDEMLTENVISLLDSEASVSDLFGTYQFPETYLINRDMGINAKWIGPQKWSEAWGANVMDGIQSLSRFKKVPDPVQSER